MSKTQKSRPAFQSKNAVFIRAEVRDGLCDLLDFVEHGELAMAAAEETVDTDTRSLLAGCFRDATLQMIESVRKSGIEDAAMLDTKHPDYEDARAGIQTAIAFKHEMQSQERAS